MLRRERDPVGRGQIEDLPSDEYDSYAPHVVSLIRDGADDGVIAAHVSKLESETMGLNSGLDLRSVTARLLAVVAAASDRAT